MAKKGKDYGIPKGPTSPKRKTGSSGYSAGAYPGSSMARQFVPSDTMKVNPYLPGYKAPVDKKKKEKKGKKK
jgi:hypothetical protein